MQKKKELYILSCGLSPADMQQEDVSMKGIVESHWRNNWKKIKENHIEVWKKTNSIHSTDDLEDLN